MATVFYKTLCYTIAVVLLATFNLSLGFKTSTISLGKLSECGDGDGGGDVVNGDEGNGDGGSHFVNGWNTLTISGFGGSSGTVSSNGGGGADGRSEPYNRRNRGDFGRNGNVGNGLVIRPKRRCTNDISIKTSAFVELSTASQEQLQWMESYKQLNGSTRPSFEMDRALLTINSTVHFDIQIFMQTTECYKCPLNLRNQAAGKETTPILVSSTTPMIMQLAKATSGNNVETICNMTYHFLEGGDYWIFINYTSYTNGYCDILLANKPVNQNYSILFVFGGLILLAIVWNLMKLIYRSRRKETSCCKRRSNIVPIKEGIEHSTEMVLNEDEIKAKDVEKCVEFTDIESPAAKDGEKEEKSEKENEEEGEEDEDEEKEEKGKDTVVKGEKKENKEDSKISENDGGRAGGEGSGGGGIIKKSNEIDVIEDEKKGNTEKTLNTKDSKQREQTKPVKARKRLNSLDTLRGIAITIMIFVNYGGGGYVFFEHAQWNGLTVADLVFPWFIFIMGTAMNFSFRSLLRKKVSKWWIALKIIRRSATLFALGIWLNTAWGPVELDKLRIPGVLQRFSLTYLFLALMVIAFARVDDNQKAKQLSPFRDILLHWPEWFLNFALLAVHIGITFALPVPGCPTGYLGPGGISEGGQYYNCTGGAAQYVDKIVLGESHLYQHPTVQEDYKTKIPFDPEGILGIPTSIFLCFLGLQAGRIIVQYPSHKERIFRWTVYTIATGAISAALCMTSVNDGVIPINKNLWSLSFILVNACFAFLLLTLLYIFIDVLGWWSGVPFTYAGLNSIVLYCGHNVLANYFPITWVVEAVHWKLLLMDTWGTAFWVIVAYILFRKKIFISL